MTRFVTNTERTCALEQSILANQNFLSSGALVASALSSFLVNHLQNTRVFLDPMGQGETLDQNLSQTYAKAIAVQLWKRSLKIEKSRNNDNSNNNNNIYWGNDISLFAGLQFVPDFLGGTVV